MIGVDLASRRVTIVDPDQGMYIHIEIPKQAERSGELKLLKAKLITLLDEGWFNEPAWVEAPVLAGARNIQTTIAIAQTSGLVHSVLPNSHDVSVATWKQRTVGNGHATKDDVRAWLDTHHPEYAKRCFNQDLYDACCIALFGRSAAVAERGLLHL